MGNIKELRQKRADLVHEGRALLDAASANKGKFSEEQEKRYEAIQTDLEALEPDIQREERQMDAERRIGLMQDPAVVAHTADPAQTFASFGEQLQAVNRAVKSNGREIDRRLYAAPTGASEGVPADGGFFVQQDFSAELLQKTHEIGQILSRVRRIPISANANSLKMLGMDESSRVAGSRWGGIQVYRLEEAGTKTATKPAYRKIELTLKKLAALYYATDELLEDASALGAIATQAFSEEMSFTIENEILSGTGAGQFLGILNSPSLVTVAKETGQAAKTVVFENIVKMWSRCWGRSRQNAVWLINQDVEPALYGMGLVVGTGGTPAYLPPGGLSGSPYGTLFGRPVIAVEYCSALGTVGDIILADFSQYLMIEKGGLQTAVSIHVQFKYDETVFRFVLRNDGQPLWNAALTPFKGTNTLSPFVVLAARA